MAQFTQLIENILKDLNEKISIEIGGGAVSELDSFQIVIDVYGLKQKKSFDKKNFLEELKKLVNKENAKANIHYMQVRTADGDYLLSIIITSKTHTDFIKQIEKNFNKVKPLVFKYLK